MTIRRLLTYSKGLPITFQPNLTFIKNGRVISGGIDVFKYFGRYLSSFELLLCSTLPNIKTRLRLWRNKLNAAANNSRNLMTIKQLNTCAFKKIFFHTKNGNRCFSVARSTFFPWFILVEIWDYNVTTCLTVGLDWKQSILYGLSSIDCTCLLVANFKSLKWAVRPRW